jgi:uncharacterized tellurite resistance protein B-like protein
MSTHDKQLLKILIGAAWLDGKVQPEEQQRLQRVAKQKGLLDDAELHPWLHGLRSVSTEECHRWIDEYLGKHPVPENVQELLEEISGLIYSDGDVDSAEARFLTQLQQKDASVFPGPTLHETITRAVQKLYHRWVNQ